MTSNDSVHIGTSGWHYHHWIGRYYPQDLPADKWLEWYTRDFSCVEINNSFYQLPLPDSILRWRDTTPKDFVFSVKASRLMTHLKKLNNCSGPLTAFLDRITLFGPKLGPILFQLPPRWHLNLERLAKFLERLPIQYQYAFEFRDPSWHCDPVYDLLATHQIAFCLFNLAGLQAPEKLTARLIYIRLHGPGAAYCGSYDDKTLRQWAMKIHSWALDGRQVYVYFDNDEAGYAVMNAKTLCAFVKEQGRS